MKFMANFLVGGRLIHSHFLLSPFIKPAWCGEISLYSDLEPNANPTKVESTGKMKNGNENVISVVENVKKVSRFPNISHQISNETHQMKNEQEWNAKYQTGISIKSQKKNRSSSCKTSVWAQMFSLYLMSSPWASVLSQVWTAGGGIYVMLCQISDIGVWYFHRLPFSLLSRSEQLNVSGGKPIWSLGRVIKSYDVT